MSWRRGADFYSIGAVRNGVGMNDPLACTSLPRVSGVGPGMAGGRGRWRSSCSWDRRTVADDVVPQGFPPDLPWPVRGQVQRRFAGGAAKRAGTVTRSRRRVAPRATACSPPASVPAARSRLWAITAQASQAQLAANSPDGMRASGPSIRSAKVVSTIACFGG